MAGYISPYFSEKHGIHTKAEYVQFLKNHISNQAKENNKTMNRYFNYAYNYKSSSIVYRNTLEKDKCESGCVRLVRLLAAEYFGIPTEEVTYDQMMEFLSLDLDNVSYNKEFQSMNLYFAEPRITNRTFTLQMTPKDKDAHCANDFANIYYNDILPVLRDDVTCLCRLLDMSITDSKFTMKLLLRNVTKADEMRFTDILRARLDKHREKFTRGFESHECGELHV